VSAYLSLAKTPVSVFERDIYMIYNVCTDPTKRRKGLMKSLLAQTIRDVLVSSSLEPSIGLFVDETNTDALHLYEKLGFTQTTTTDWRTWNMPVPQSPQQILMLHTLENKLLEFSIPAAINTHSRSGRRIGSRHLGDWLNPSGMKNCVLNAFQTIGLLETQQDSKRIGQQKLTHDVVLALLRKKMGKIIHSRTMDLFWIGAYLRSGKMPSDDMFTLMYMTFPSKRFNHITVLGRTNKEPFLIDLQLDQPMQRGLDNILRFLGTEPDTQFSVFTITSDYDVSMNLTPEIIASQKPLRQTRQTP